MRRQGVAELETGLQPSVAQRVAAFLLLSPDSLGHSPPSSNQGLKTLLCPFAEMQARACIQGPQKVLGMIQMPPLSPPLASGLPPPTGSPSLFLTVLSPSSVSPSLLPA